MKKFLIFKKQLIIALKNSKNLKIHNKKKIMKRKLLILKKRKEGITKRLKSKKKVQNFLKNLLRTVIISFKAVQEKIYFCILYL